MKKLIAILLTFAVLCCFGVSALAADTEVHKYVWEEIATDAAKIDPDGGIKGGIQQVGSYCIWLPSFYAAQDLSQERINQGYIANFVSADQSSAVMAFNDTNEEKTDLETLAEAYTDAGLEAEVVRVNGIPALQYVNTESDTVNIMYLEGENATLTFSFYPYSDEGFADLCDVMISSLRRSLVWAQVEDTAARVDPNGKIAKIGNTNLGLWVPSVLTNYELTEEEMVEFGELAFLAAEDGPGSLDIYIDDSLEFYLDLMWGGRDIDSLLKYYESEDSAEEDVVVVMINGIETVVVNDVKDEYTVVNLPLIDGSILAFYFSGVSDESFAQLSSLMIASIQIVS